MEEKREAKKLMRDMKIITAISVGKNRNKDLAQVLDTDKSYAAKRIKELEQRGLVNKQGTGKEVRYSINEFNVLKFLKSRVIITWQEKEKENTK